MRRAAIRSYRLLLRLVPRALREEYGDEILDSLRDELRHAADRGPLHCTAVFVGAAWDIVRRGTYEHWRRRGRRPTRERDMHAIVSDLRFALRTFARQKGATALLLVTLTLAVAANVAVFSLLDGLFFRPFPFPSPSRLVYLNEQAPAWNLEYTGIDYKHFLGWRERARAFESMALFDGGQVNLSDGERSERANGLYVTHDYARVLGIRPLLGRTFTPEEDRPDGAPVVVIGEAMWRGRFGGATDVLGRTLRINSVPHAIIGVLPREAEFPTGAQFWIPLAGDPNQQGEQFSYDGIGRLRPGVTVEQARLDLIEAHRPTWAASDTAHVVSPRIMSLRDRFVADYTTMGAALAVGVALVLLIACANVAGAVLARAVLRQRELGIRLALGASASRVGRQLLTESLLLSSAAGVLGTLVGWWAITVGTRAVPDLLPAWAHVAPDARTVAFAVGIVIVTALLFGLAPALQVRRHDVGRSIGTGAGRAAGSVPQRRMLHALVVGEVALAAMLVSGGGLLLRGYDALRHTDPGFRVDSVATFRLALPRAKYATGTQRRTLFETTIARLRTLPGAVDAGGISCLPLTCHLGDFFESEGFVRTRPNAPDPVTLARVASPSYFHTMDIRLLHGRTFREGEGTRPGSIPVVVNESFARYYWPGLDDPTGKRIRGRGDTSATAWFTVVGVTRDDRHYGLATPMRPSVFFPLASMNSTLPFIGSFGFAIHTRGDPAPAIAAVRRIVREIDPELPLWDARTMRSALEASLATRRALAGTLVVFAVIALTLAIGGVYAVLSYVVGRRRHEIGIRIALGAQRRQVVGHVVRQGGVLIGVGLLIGIPFAALGSRALGSLLSELGANDPLIYGAAVVLLGVTGIAAALVPARRAAAVEPREAMGD